MPGELGDAPLAGQPDHGDGGVAHRLGGVAVRDHAVLDRAVELVEVAELVEGGGDLRVREVGHRTAVGYAPLMPGPAWIVLPTYNEAGHLGPLVQARARESVPDARVLVVDDGSPDGTGADRRRAGRGRSGGRGAAPPAQGRARARLRRRLRARAGGRRRLRRRDGRRLLPRPRRPAAPARARARRAPTSCSARATSPAAASRTGTCCGARSRAAGCLYARTVLGVPIRDLTGGFKCFRAATLEAISYETVRSQGYAFQVELTYRALARGLRVEELPIVFRERGAGESKMSARIALEAAWLVPALRLARRRDGAAGGARLRRAGQRADQLRHEDGGAGPRPGLGRHTGGAGPLEGAPAARARPLGARQPGRGRAAADRDLDRRARSRCPTRRGSCCAGAAARGTLADYGFVLYRNGLVLALHALACVAGFIAGSSLPRSWRRATRASGAGSTSSPARSRSPSWARRRCSRSPRRPTRSAAPPRPAPPTWGSPRRCCWSSLLPHAIPELFALFLPLAAWTIASRRGEWDELLAATFVTVAIAVPMLLAAGAIEVWVTPRCSSPHR